jgi:conserved domain protein
MEEIVKHINDTNASYRSPKAGDARNTDLFLDNEHYDLFKGLGEKIRVRFSKKNLSQAILFIASILPRKYDNSSVHRRVDYSPLFVEEQLAMLDGYFMEDGVSVESKTQEWNVRKDVQKKDGSKDPRFYFKGLLEEFSFQDHTGSKIEAKFTIRNYLAGGFSDLHILRANDGIFDVFITNTYVARYEEKDNGIEQFLGQEEDQSKLHFPLQAIYYGAPGTGKSYKIKSLEKGKATKPVRTTFHPDSDYATFVGAYKPTMEIVPRYDSSTGNQVEEKRIAYNYVPQAFLKAYVQAWVNYPESQYLVIEEINRGNCAQIFGDLFQLLDRSASGFSEYPIAADSDISKYLLEVFSKEGKFALTEEQREEINALYEGEYADVMADVQVGELLLLPNNLHILATMNTSDQSLFPIDSAFKRRWEWEYVPIRNANKGWVIAVDGKEWDWWSFLEAINAKIGSVTDSEDKKLGYFFVKPSDNHTITAETFVSKVIFYLWNDVFKDYGFRDEEFQTKDGKEMSFPMFYETENEGQRVNEALVAQFIQNVVENATEVIQEGETAIDEA